MHNYQKEDENTDRKYVRLNHNIKLVASVNTTEKICARCYCVLCIYRERNNRKIIVKYLFCGVSAFPKAFYSNQINMTNKKQEKSYSIGTSRLDFCVVIYVMTFRKTIVIITSINGK